MHKTTSFMDDFFFFFFSLFAFTTFFEFLSDSEAWCPQPQPLGPVASNFFGQGSHVTSFKLVMGLEDHYTRGDFGSASF